MMEPQDRMAKQDQFLFRVFRIGQQARLWGYILYNPDCEKEEKVLRRQHLRSSWKGLIQNARGGELAENAVEAIRGSAVN